MLERLLKAVGMLLTDLCCDGGATGQSGMFSLFKMFSDLLYSEWSFRNAVCAQVQEGKCLHQS